MALSYHRNPKKSICIADPEMREKDNMIDKLQKKSYNKDVRFRAVFACDAGRYQKQEDLSCKKKNLCAVILCGP